MAKILWDSVEEKLLKLDQSIISYESEKGIVNILIDKEITNNQEAVTCVISINGNVLLEKCFGYNNDTKSSWNYETFTFDDFEIRNIPGHSQAACYSIDGYDFVDGVFYNQRFKQCGTVLCGNRIITKINENVGVYFDSKKNEKGILIGKMEQRIDSFDEENSDYVEQVENALTLYNQKIQTIVQTLMSQLEKSIKIQNLIELTGEKYETIRNFICNSLSLQLNLATKLDMIMAIEDIQKRYVIYQEVLKRRDILNEQVKEINTILEECLNYHFGKEKKKSIYADQNEN